jgi:hypothetical protein
MGHHQVIKKQGTQPNVVRPNDLIIAHAPFSTSARFLRKLENIDRSLTTFGHRLVGPEAWHWRRWLQIAREGKVDEEFRRQALTEEQFQARLRDATIQSGPRPSWKRWRAQIERHLPGCEGRPDLVAILHRRSNEGADLCNLPWRYSRPGGQNEHAVRDCFGRGQTSPRLGKSDR